MAAPLIGSSFSFFATMTPTGTTATRASEPEKPPSMAIRKNIMGTRTLAPLS